MDQHIQYIVQQSTQKGLLCAAGRGLSSKSKESSPQGAVLTSEARDSAEKPAGLPPLRIFSSWSMSATRVVSSRETVTVLALSLRRLQPSATAALMTASASPTSMRTVSKKGLSPTLWPSFLAPAVQQSGVSAPSDSLALELLTHQVSAPAAAQWQLDILHKSSHNTRYFPLAQMQSSMVSAHVQEVLMHSQTLCQPLMRIATWSGYQ